MISNTLYNHDLHVILVRNLAFYELEKKLFVTPAEYAATEFDFRIIFSRHWHHDQPPLKSDVERCQAESKCITVTAVTDRMVVPVRCVVP